MLFKDEPRYFQGNKQERDGFLSILPYYEAVIITPFKEIIGVNNGEEKKITEHKLQNGEVYNLVELFVSPSFLARINDEEIISQEFQVEDTTLLVTAKKEASHDLTIKICYIGISGTDESINNDFQESDVSNALEDEEQKEVHVEDNETVLEDVQEPNKETEKSFSLSPDAILEKEEVESDPDDIHILNGLPHHFGPKKEIIDSLLKHMASFDASGLFIKGNSEVWMSVQGMKKKVTRRKITSEEARNLLSAVYAKGGTANNIVDRMEPLNFAYQIMMPEHENGRIRFRVNAISNISENSTSITLTFRLIQSVPPTIEQLKIPKDIVDACVENDKGIIYVAGATGQGKSTTLAAIIRHILEKEDANINMVDIGEPIEYVMDLLELPSSFVTPLEVGKNVKSFAKAVENCMRMEPQIIQISESRDMETISASLDASKSGHAVYTTVHSGTVAESLRRIVNMFPYEIRDVIQLDVIESTKMIIAQKLIETVDGKRTAIREYLIFTPTVREALWNAKNIAKTAIEMVEQYGHPMTKDLDIAFENGTISESVYNKYKREYNNEIEASKRSANRGE